MRSRRSARSMRRVKVDALCWAPLTFRVGGMWVGSAHLSYRAAFY
jgi:hypothetical protein